MISLRRDPDGENVFSKTMPSSPHLSQTGKEVLKENERVIETLRNRVKELESSLQQDGPLNSSGEHTADRKLSMPKVTFSEDNTLILKNAQPKTSSVNGSINNLLD